MKNILIAALILGCSFSLNACIERKPEGPAELIGKGLDQMSEGFRKIDRDEQERRARERKRYDSEFTYDQKGDTISREPTTHSDGWEDDADENYLNRDRNFDRRY